MKITIATPTAYYVHPEYMKAIIDAIKYAQDKDKRLDITYNFFKGYMVDMSRNQLAYEAIQSKQDYIIFIDSDTIIKKETIYDLVNFSTTNKINVVAGWQRRRQNYKDATETFKLTPTDDIVDRLDIKDLEDATHPFEIKGTGFGCVLVEVDILKALFEEGILPFKYIKYPDGSVLSEDLYFCHNVRKAMNEKIYVMPHLRCGHIWNDIF